MHSLDPAVAENHTAQSTAGLLPTQGQIHFNGQCWQDQNTHLPAYQRAAGFVFQDNRLFPHLNVAGNCTLLVKGQPRAVSTTKMSSIHWASTALVQNDHRPVWRRGKARSDSTCTCKSTATFTYGRATEWLRSNQQARNFGHLRRLNRHFSLPTLYVSHDIEEVARLCDHMLVMNAGRVIDQGRTASIIEKLNQNPDQAVSPVGSVIHGSEWPSNRLFAD